MKTNVRKKQALFKSGSPSPFEVLGTLLPYLLAPYAPYTHIHTRIHTFRHTNPHTYA
jgi:hypothetical protein